MYRLLSLSKRFYTGSSSTTTETILDHFNRNGKGYSFMAGLIASGLAGMNYMVGLQIKPLQGEVHEIKSQLTEMKNQQREDMTELRSLLQPLITQVQVNQQRFEKYNKVKETAVQTTDISEEETI